MPMDTSPSVEPVPIKPKMSSGRKSSKPLMEKRRRARINDSLGQLKSLILEATNKDTSRHSKLEKADILEMTVKYLRNMQRRHMTGVINDSAELNRYRLGYNECITEVSRYFDSSQSGVQLRTQLIGHLANHVSPPPSPIPQQQQPHSIAFTPVPTPAPVIATAAMVPPPSSHSVQVQVAQSPIPNIQSVTVPSGAIASGEIRVVLPSEALPGGQLPSHFIPVYAHGNPSLSSSIDTPSSPTPPQTYQPSFQQIQELSSPFSYEQHHVQHQTVPLSYMVGVAPTTSPLAGSIAPPVAIQTPTLVAKPADVHIQTAPTELHILVQAKQHEMQQQPQHHPHYQSSQENALKTVNINVQQQFAGGSEDESVWRPW